MTLGSKKGTLHTQIKTLECGQPALYCNNGVGVVVSSFSLSMNYLLL